jgi:hypothetical protein
MTLLSYRLNRVRFAVAAAAPVRMARARKATWERVAFVALASIAR